ncbi:hypothetical protein K402DRAFT_337832 [Aulographum hederae CBS 113979]|uniref:Ribosomal protein L9 domain-containing protein n=1 Tax=Aulographum hederae CBS 113979 TaxID=1176131 RepID=A0A6G1GRL9_9PEZI|nr:hypothetical protein K402DRAFT_337832 [Aulographum hederae CBS 113979]
MAARVRPTLSHCTSCARTLTDHGWGTPLVTKQFVRGKQKLADKNEGSGITVKLLKPIIEYGKPGAIVKVPPGTMRNDWFANRLADYVPHDELRDMKRKGIVPERDFTFDAQAYEAFQQEMKAQRIERQEVAKLKLKKKDARLQKPAAKLNSTPPHRSVELIDLFLPAKLEFRRKANENDATQTEQKMPIFGSVSTGDVGAVMKSLLSRNDEAAKVAILDDDIKFVGDSIDDPTRVKHMGEYTVELKIKGAAAPVLRVVRVMPMAPKAQA